jgi:two-component system, chemotaxis family, CheB/CheR fusion protein
VEMVSAEISAKGQELIIENTDEEVVLYVDSVRIAQVIMNLLHNATKFSGRGDRIVLRVKHDGDTAVLQVKDTGVGIARDKLDSIFEVFVQVDSSIERRRSGLGLGLTLVKSLVELHGGSVRASSGGEGLGSEFEVRLPILQARAHTAAHEAMMNGLATRRVIVIDDNVDSADSLSVLLRMMSHQVMTLYHGKGVVDHAAHFKPDVILCDLGMPEVSGLEVARQLRADETTCRITLVAITGYGRPEDIELARQSGFDAHLVKPVDLNRVNALLRAAPRAFTS